MLVAALLIATRDRTTAASTQVYFYDLSGGALFGAERTAEPPIDAPSGPGNGVKAVVYGCGDCTEANLQIAYLMTNTDEARQAMAQVESLGSQGGPVAPELAMKIQNGQRVAIVPESGEVKWVSSTSPEGIAILSPARELCAGQSATPCSP